MNRTNYERKFEKDYNEMTNKYNEVLEENKQMKYEYMLLKSKYDNKCNQLEKTINNFEENAKAKYQPLLDEKDKEISDLKSEIERLKGLLNTDGTNSGLPTSMTPLNKKKVIPNTRVKSGKPKGGQIGHPKHKLERFNDDEVTEEEIHELNECPCCGGELEEIGEIEKDELSFQIAVIKRRYKFKKYVCKNCHKEVHDKIPNNLKEENQYGTEVKATALTLVNIGNVPINKTRNIIKGFTHGEINISEGYIAKLQKRASQKLAEFKQDLYLELLKLKVLFWDDTVITINGKRACMRFYGNEKLAYYTAHEKKNKTGVDEDNILNTLSKETKVMHDHNILNYNEDYCFENLECNVHLLRDLQKCYDNTQHDWCSECKQLIQDTKHEKDILIAANDNLPQNEKVTHFDDEFIQNFDSKFNDIILKGITQNKALSKNHHYLSEERALTNRILDYKVNYFMWLYDFSLPTNDNLSERGLRGVKSKMKISGQFQSIENARYYADIRSYIETCYRNDINPTEALNSLMNDNPYKLADMLKKGEE